MGFGRSLRHAVRKVAKSAKTIAKAPVNVIKDPVGETKKLISDPMGYISTATGLTALMAGGKLPSQTEMPQLKGDENEDARQDRTRMISRQGEQGNNPIMLLGQGVDWDSLDLSKDSELGGKKA